MSAGLPQLAGRPMVTDGGLETDLIFNHGVDLPEFAAFPLLDSDSGRTLLTDYYAGYAEIAAAVDVGLLLESATWRANPDWGTALGYDAARLRRVNVDAIDFLHGLRTTWAGSIDTIVVSGTLGPRGDGYAVGSGVDADEAADYHRPQLASFAEAGADCAAAYTLTDPGEAIGIVRAARSIGIPIAISFTVETDGRLPGGMELSDIRPGQAEMEIPTGSSSNWRPTVAAHIAPSDARRPESRLMESCRGGPRTIHAQPRRHPVISGPYDRRVDLLFEAHGLRGAVAGTAAIRDCP